MSQRPILHWPDPRLSQRCIGVPKGAALAALTTDMLETMYAAKGRGLAAPQIGEMCRVFVMDAGWKEGAPTPLVCVAPAIVAHSSEVLEMEEGCLSIPGVVAPVTRPARVTLRFADLQGQWQERALTGAEARIAQHELDHLDGKVHFDRLAPPLRADLEAQYAALA